ncbi:MAG: DUF1289 domain-containing protein [Rhizobiaceae bacterium]|nr:DUF1289 domain-containing protein [Rhizobiaceae bacterium]MCV0404907.1 DUF1289 domain-containing protein [Rhizobiaceae bacterium]
MARVDSPCIRVCRQDRAAGFCVGCGRTVMEVFRWSEFSEEDRTVILRRLPDRLESLPAEKRMDAARPSTE